MNRELRRATPKNIPISSYCKIQDYVVPSFSRIIDKVWWSLGHFQWDQPHCQCPKWSKRRTWSLRYSSHTNRWSNSGHPNRGLDPELLVLLFRWILRTTKIGKLSISHSGRRSCKGVLQRWRHSGSVTPSWTGLNLFCLTHLHEPFHRKHPASYIKLPSPR